MWPLFKSNVTKSIIVFVLYDAVNIVLLSWLSCCSVDLYFRVTMIKGLLLVATAYILHCDGAVVVKQEHKLSNEGTINHRPIIGVLSQEQSFYLHGKFPEENYTSYIASSYVKDVEASGARVVPILIGKDRSYYEELLRKLNGVLIPGGATYFNQSHGYADAGEHIFQIAKQLNDDGVYFPVFGTCLGFELILILDSSGRDLNENRIRCYSFENLPLEFTDDFRDSKMFADIPQDLVDILAHQDVTINAHQFCIDDGNMESYKMFDDWRVMSYNHDENGVKFISTVEHKRYPFYGVQFHPEKNSFEWKASKHHAHSPSAIRSNRYFMDFFVNECRRNDHKFANAAEENSYLIYNYEPIFTGVLGSAFHQCYMFEPRGRVV